MVSVFQIELAGVTTNGATNGAVQPAPQSAVVSVPIATDHKDTKPAESLVRSWTSLLVFTQLFEQGSQLRDLAGNSVQGGLSDDEEHMMSVEAVAARFATSSSAGAHCVFAVCCSRVYWFPGVWLWCCTVSARVCQV